MAHECFECGVPLDHCKPGEEPTRAYIENVCDRCYNKMHGQRVALPAADDCGPFKVGHRKAYYDVYVWETFDDWQDACRCAFKLFNLYGDVRIKQA